MITYKKPAEIALMRESGRVLARTMRLTAESIVPGKTTLLDLNDLADKLIREKGGIPSFLGYKPGKFVYPASICTSLNEEVVHGIPDDRTLQSGDIISLDFGVILNGWHSDSAWTFAVGDISDEARRLMSVTKESLMQGIARAKVGNTVGDIASTIQAYVEKNGYGIVRELVGHGIGRSLHEDPQVPNFGRAGKGPVLKEGMTFCIEPMVNMGSPKVFTKDDDWTVVAADGKLSAHFEHTVAVTRDGPMILTTEED
ncbi:MAG: type I methionyl aminopeptidase [Armatimonadetes bacterium]|nr:type I methionyl aminopeptidase [Armatimonadota bacterium]